MNTEESRPSPCDLFLTAERRLEVYFHTSNEDKYLHARAACRGYGLDIKHFRSHTEPYHEDYSEDKCTLLERAIDEMLTVVGKSSLFFVEDTSVRIEALSDEVSDFPGLAVKEWFSAVSFENLDDQLKAAGGDRRATVKSDIALHVPGLRRPVFFSGDTTGSVALSAPAFEPSPRYPWLTPKTFNGWFIPDGATKRLGEMSFEESCYFDFRVKALRSLLERLEEYAAILNVAPHAYTRRVRRPVAHARKLFGPDKQSLIVLGRTCAGKTTFGQRAEEGFGLRHVDASGIMRSFREEYRDSEADAGAFAARVLGEKGPDIVARKILELYEQDIENGLVITGFRTIEELNTIKAEIPNALVVLVDASPRLRFERYLNRGRDSRCVNLEQFKEIDQRQWVFGLLRIVEAFADVKIVNEGSLQVSVASVAS